MSKKILSIALAVVMLFSVLACTAGAANTTVTTTFPAEGQVGFRVVTDAYVGQPAGEEVTVKVYWVHPVGTDYDSWLQTNGNIVLCYTDAFDYGYEKAVGYEGRTWGASYADYLKEDAPVNCNYDTYINSTLNALTTADKAYGWDKAMMINTAVNTGVTSNAKGFPLDPDCEIFSLAFTTTREVTAEDSIGIPANTITAKSTAAAYSTGSKRVQYAPASIVNSEGVAKANVVAGDDTATAKMRPGTAAGTVDLGLTGTVKTASFKAGKEWGAGCYVAPNLANVGVQARVNGVVSAGESTCIYETTDGFNYRAAITGIDAAGLGAQIEVRTYITDVNGNTYFSNWMFIDAADVHTNAVGNGMTGII